MVEQREMSLSEKLRDIAEGIATFADPDTAPLYEAADYIDRMYGTTKRLGEALEQILDDMGETGLCVCPAAKAQAQEALRSLWPKSEFLPENKQTSAPNRHSERTSA